MRSRKGERGGALLLSVIISISVVAISGAFISHSMIKSRTSFDSMMGLEALMTAESGAAAYVQALNMKKNNPSFPAPAASFTQKFVKDSTVYRLWAENVGANGADDNGDGVIDDTIEQGFMRLWVDGHAGGMWDAAAGKYNGGSKRTLEVILAGQSGGVFWNAIFAGNNDGDPNFQLTFENGNNNSRDIIKGNIYSGGNITHLGIAELLNDKGTAGASQVMYKDSLKSNNSQKPPPTYVNGVQSDLDVAGMNYDKRAAAAASNAITDPFYDPKMVNVTSALNGTDARYSVGLEANGFVANGDASRGRAGSAEAQINKNFATTNPAHLFRKNVTDSGSNRAHQDYKTVTPKDDYFLEDSSTNYGNGSPQGDWLGSDGGQMLDVHTTGNDKVYYIDGNLWLANSPTYTFQFQNKTGSNMRITIVVKGNIYLCDNLLYERDASGAIKGNDGVALIAINDDKFKSVTPADIDNPSHPAYDYGGAAGLPYKKRVEAARDYNRTFGSGNVFFGDPAGGTTERFESFLYAQNNFYDNNLGANGTNMTNIFGNMTAGNHVEIQRQVGNFKPTHVTFDTRIRDGSLNLAGLPGNPNSGDKDFKIASWRQVPGKPVKFGP